VSALISHQRIDCLSLTANETTRASLGAISYMLPSGSRRIPKLDLGSQQFKQKERMDVSILTLAIHVNISLIKSDLSNNELVDPDLVNIYEALDQNRTLQKVVNDPKILDVGVKLFASNSK
jgi:hypothetical protein